MSSMNKVFVMGNLTRDPELRQTPSGAAVVELGVAVNEDYRNKAGEIVKSVCFVDVVAWNRQAETCAQYLHKGSGVLVEGKLQQDHWETPEGQKKSRMRVRAIRVQFLGNGKKNSAEAAKGSSAAGPANETQAAAPDEAEPVEENLPF